MAQHKSAVKRARQAEARRANNRQRRGRVRSAVKRVREALAAKDGGSAASLLREAESALRRAASKRVIPKKRASRRVSRLAKAAHRLGGGGRP
jgi:small subunit ribosomal protein S20